jgi:phosphotransferase system HPr-like phosphotransfer protein
MSRIQQLPGAVDFLTQGLMAGSKLAATAAELQSRKIQNQLMAEELDFADRRKQLEEAAILSQNELRGAQTELTRFQTQAQQGIDVEKQTKVSGAQQKQNLALIEALKSPDMSPAEATAAIALQIPNLQASGFPIEEGNVLHQSMAALLLNQSSQFKKELELENKKAQSIQEFRAAQIGFTQARTGTVISPQEEALLGVAARSAEQITEKRSALTAALAFEKDPESKAQFEAQIRNLDAQLEEALRSLGLKGRTQQGQQKLKVGDVVDGFKYLGGNTNDPNNWEQQ